MPGQPARLPCSAMDALRQVVPPGAVGATGPCWDITSATLLRAHPDAPSVHRFTPDTGADEATVVPQQVGAVVPRARGGLVLNLRDGIALLDGAGARHWLCYWARPGRHAGAAAVDGSGTLWATSVPDRGTGWLVRVAPDGAATVVRQDAAGAGIACDPDSSLLYLSDPAGRVDVLDPDTGDRRPLCPVPEPGGLCLDAEGAVWVTVPGGVRRYLPDGTADVAVPVPAATGCAFGGMALTDLYVTTADGALLVLPDAGQGRPTTVFAG